ncbi:DUF4381 family protein [Luteimonas marina]|uniref:DUF4381 family protein n=1 Tax=Luteimonas marina TaxID=488485 RepID=A0A5C5U3U1_9GAMM|nr:DUF4381 family protein [Luteimonas marina]TWT20242.1 DUF4381 family protein [Luteimonas marina]
MNPLELPLRDVHEPAAPPWWPPAPGWWIVFGVLLAVVAALAWWRWRRARRRRLAARLFDGTVAAADTPAKKIAAISELLRRAARRRDPAADTLDGDAWLRLLDSGLPQPVFASGAGALLLEGAFRPAVDENAVEALRIAARARFLDWMAPGR